MPGKNAPVRTAVLGLGRIGWNHHAALLRQRRDYEIVAVADPVAERRAQAAAELGCPAFASLKGLLARPEVELVIVATRSVDHARQAQACLEAGKHVLLEKPAATRLADLDATLKLARRRGRIITVHQNNRFSDRTLYLKKAIASGIIGEVFEIKITAHHFSLRNDWQTLKKNGGGHLFNHGAHWIDAAIFLMPGPVVEVWGDMKHLLAGGDADDYFKVILRSANGCLADIEASMAAKYPHDMIVIMGTRGTITAGEAVAISHFKPSGKAARAGVIDGPAPGRRYGQVSEAIKLREKTVTRIPPQGADFYGNLAQAIRCGGKLLITPESVREQMRVIQLVRDMAARKKGGLYKR